MGRPYLLSRFLRQTPNRLLKQYFGSRNLLKSVDFDVSEERDIDRIREAIHSLADADRQQVEADLRDIDALACERGFRAVMDGTPSTTRSIMERITIFGSAYHQARRPAVYIEAPDLNDLAEGRRLPHVYEQKPPRLCLYLPRTGEWHPSLRLDRTIVPYCLTEECYPGIVD